MAKRLFPSVMMDLVPALLLIGIIALSGVLLLRSMNGCPALLEWLYVNCGTGGETSPAGLTISDPIRLDGAAVGDPNSSGSGIDQRTFVGSAP